MIESHPGYLKKVAKSLVARERRWGGPTRLDAEPKLPNGAPRQRESDVCLFESLDIMCEMEKLVQSTDDTKYEMVGLCIVRHSGTLVQSWHRELVLGVAAGGVPGELPASSASSRR